MSYSLSQAATAIGMYRSTVLRAIKAGKISATKASRVAFVQIMANQRKESAVAFLEAAVAYYRNLNLRIERQ